MTLAQVKPQAEGRLDRPSKRALFRAYDLLLEHRARRLAAEEKRPDVPHKDIQEPHP